MALEDRDFYNWFAGFVDGEGCFNIINRKYKDQSRYSINFTIGLRQDDCEILETLRAKTGLGKIYYYDEAVSGGNPRCIWRVSKRSELLELVDILDTHPLRAKKKEDYKIWRKALMDWPKTQKFVQSDWANISVFKASLTNERKYKLVN